MASPDHHPCQPRCQLAPVPAEPQPAEPQRAVPRPEAPPQAEHQQAEHQQVVLLALLEPAEVREA